MKRELKIAPLKVYFFFTAFNNSKQGFQRHRKVFLWGIYAAPTSGAVQTQAHLALSLQSGSGRQLVVDVTIFSNNIRDIMSFTIFASQLEHFSRNPVGVQKFEFPWPGTPWQGLSTPSCSLLFLSVIRLSVTIEGWEGLETWGDGTRAPFTNPLATPLFAQQVQPMEISTFQHGHVVKTISS